MEFIFFYYVFSVIIAVSADSDVVDNDDYVNRCTVVPVVIVAVVVVVAVLL
jgi:hypothetical protein